MPENAQSVLASFGFADVGHGKSGKARWAKYTDPTGIAAEEVLQYAPIEAAADVFRKEMRSLMASYLEPSQCLVASTLPGSYSIGWTPSPFSQELENTINESNSILELEVSPDAGIDAPYTEETLRRAVQLLREVAETFWNATGSHSSVPSIGPAEAGSIDLFWELSDVTLLINVPADAVKNATYYGRRQSGSKTSGLIAPGDLEVRHLTGWLIGRSEGVL